MIFIVLSSNYAGAFLYWAVIAGLLGHIARCALALRRNRLLAPERELAWTALLAWGAGTLAVLLGPRGGAGTLNLIPLRTVWEWVSGDRNLRRVVQFNLLAFIPPGLLLPALFKKLRKWNALLLAALGGAAAVEIVQYFIGRTADIDAVLLRAAGCMAGYGLYRVAAKRWKGKQTVESRFMPEAR